MADGAVNTGFSHMRKTAGRDQAAVEVAKPLVSRMFKKGGRYDAHLVFPGNGYPVKKGLTDIESSINQDRKPEFAGLHINGLDAGSFSFRILKHSCAGDLFH
jgi:hypothetical protein